MTTLDGTALARALRAAADALHPTPAGPRPVANALPDEYPPRVNDPAGERKILDDFLDRGFVAMEDLTALRRRVLVLRDERNRWEAAAVETHRSRPDPNAPAENQPASPSSATVAPEPPHPGVSGARRGSGPLTGQLEGWHAVFAGEGQSPIHIRDGVPLTDTLARYLDDANTTAEAKLAMALRGVLIVCTEQQEFMIDAERRAAERTGNNQRLDDITQGHRTGMIEMANRAIGAALRSLSPADMPESAEDAGWRAGVRWAAAEADAQAVQTRTVADIIDITDHLRLCASLPARDTLVERWEAPEVRP